MGHHLNFYAVLAATLSAFILGGLWYSPLLFGAAWQKANAFTAADLARQNRARIFGVSFILFLVMAINLAMFLDADTTTLSWGATAGFLAGFGWVALAFGVVGLFESRPWRYIAVNGGYMVVAFVVMGAFIGGWR